VDLNPVKAGMVEQPADYRWSGYRERTGEKLLYPLLADFSELGISAKAYQEYVETEANLETGLDLSSFTKKLQNCSTWRNSFVHS
jgi:hypothetical protein